MARKKFKETVKQRGNSLEGAPQLDPYKFKPGQSGNPKGRPRRKTIPERMAELLEAESLDGVEVPEGCCVADVIARNIVVNACQGRFVFTKELIDRLEGKVPDRIIDETPDAHSDRDRTELDSLLATLRKRAGIAPVEDADRTSEPGRNGDVHERWEMGDGPASGPPE
jgi:hypothetical protein